MLTRFCLYGFLKNQRYFEPFLMLAFLEQGLSFFWIGTLIAIRSLTINLLEIPSGAMADSWGRRGSMIVSFVAYIFSFVTFAFAPSIVWFVVAMILYGIGDTFRTGTHKAMIFEWLRLQGREDERTRVYGITRSWSKYGSALSAILAALFVVLSGNYRAIFLFATIPYVVNIINFIGYPRELDGRPDTTRTISEVWSKLKSSLASSLKIGPLRRLIFESMSWEGIFHSIKDYLQPVLAAVVISSLAINSDSTGAENPSAAIAIGIVYTLLFLLSGLASRMAHRFVLWSGSESMAARKLWLLNWVLFALLGLSAWLNYLWVVVLLFVVINVLQNIWRPILISRFDQYTNPDSGATSLSIESQAQRLATLIAAPVVGFWIDTVSVSGDQQQYWPIGIVGGVVALIMWLSAVKSSEKR